jgi:hypothetical protein
LAANGNVGTLRFASRVRLNSSLFVLTHFAAMLFNGMRKITNELHLFFDTFKSNP